MKYLIILLFSLSASSAFINTLIFPLIANTTAITYSTTVTAAVGTPKYDLHIDLLRKK